MIHFETCWLPVEALGDNQPLRLDDIDADTSGIAFADETMAARISLIPFQKDVDCGLLVPKRLVDADTGPVEVPAKKEDGSIEIRTCYLHVVSGSVTLNERLFKTVEVSQLEQAHHVRLEAWKSLGAKIKFGHEKAAKPASEEVTESLQKQIDENYGKTVLRNILMTSTCVTAQLALTEEQLRKSGKGGIVVVVAAVAVGAAVAAVTVAVDFVAFVGCLLLSLMFLLSMLLLLLMFFFAIGVVAGCCFFAIDVVVAIFPTVVTIVVSMCESLWRLLVVVCWL